MLLNNFYDCTVIKHFESTSHKKLMIRADDTK